MSGSHDSGGHRADSGGYHADSGGYRTESGGYRTSTGGYRSASGNYRAGSGSHRVVRERRTGRRVAILLAVVGAGAVACALAAFAFLSGGTSGDRDSGQVVGSGSPDGSPTSKGELTLVPDACTLVDDALAGRLAPGAARNQADSYQGNDRQNQCVWGAYAGERKRQLTVELRALAGAAGQSATAAAQRAFASERADDESGKGLLAGQELTEKTRLGDVGDEGYVVYSVDTGQGSGEAIANVRSVNVLMTIHYSGSNKGDPLDSKAAANGVVEVAKAVLQRLTEA
ncbi:hypothetical protein [Actinomadura rubrisoli]|uniref:DUF3558 domain-containing protein n=1 Tax=Actinomadura rubrisoli TaxID=2530368 RepID=A0A4R5C5P5_9ACTN|nr:hypothetical protein [Actinomadura rubrisoli]TDD94978.1 hypothetical protein E1298_05915 [Actinomadura rubrisoli]